MGDYAELRAVNLADGITEISFAGVLLSELSFIFRTAFPGAYMLVYDIHSEFLLTLDLDEYLDGEGFLCEALDELGFLFLSRVEALNAIAELSPIMFKAWLVRSPLTEEDLRRMGYVAGNDPDGFNISAKTGNRESITLSSSGVLTISTSNSDLKRSLFEFFFERTILDNERLLRPNELDELLQGPGSLIYETGLVVELPREVRCSDGIVEFIGWSLPAVKPGEILHFSSTVPSFRIEQSGGVIKIGNKKFTTVFSYFGFVRLCRIWMDFYLTKFVPYILVTGLYLLFSLLLTGRGSGGTVLEILCEILLLWCLILLFKRT